MDTLTVFLLDLERRWGWLGTYPNDKHTVDVVLRHFGYQGPEMVNWSHTTLMEVLERAAKQALHERDQR